MMREPLASFVLLTHLPLFAQVADPHVLASSGAEGINAELKMEWTMGEFGVGIGGNNHYHFTAGFHQPDPLPEGVGLVEHSPAHGDLFFWPNPTSDVVHFRFDTTTPDVMDITVFDETGKTVATKTMGRGTNEGALPVSHLAAGTYLALFNSQGSQARTIVRFSIIR